MAYRRLASFATLLVAAGCYHPLTSRVPDMPGRYVESDLRYRQGSVPLAAALLMPEGPGPFPGAVVLQGSGNSDRSNAWARDFAEGLASRGIAVLLTDKRGCGASGGDWRHASFLDLAADGVAGVDALRSIARVDRRAVGVVGLSQGGAVAPAVAAASRHVAFVVDVSGAATSAIDQVNHEMRNTFRQAGLSDAQIQEGVLLQQAAVEVVSKGAWAEYRRRLDAALAGPLAPVAKGFPATDDSWVWDFWRRNQKYDPLAYWLQVGPRPVLVVFGADDERDNVPVAASVERLRSLVEGHAGLWSVEVVAGTGHALYEPDRPRVRRDVLDNIARTARRSRNRGGTARSL